MSEARRAVPWRHGLVALALAAVLASTVPLAARVWWIAELVSHFRLQLLIALTVLGILLAAARRARWWLAIAPAMALNVVPLAPYLAGAGLTAAESAGLEVMTVNVQWNNRRDAEILEIAEREAPDVLLVVEFTPWWNERLEALHARYPHRVLIPREDAWGLALLSRHPIESARERRLESAPVIDARVAMPAGPVRVLGVHLRAPTSAANAAQRNRQLDLLADMTAAPRGAPDEPLLVLGDFNVSPYSPFFGDWIARTGLRDTLLGQGPRMTWPSFFPLLGVPIDHCIVSADFDVVRREHFGGFGSDHYGVLVELTRIRAS